MKLNIIIAVITLLTGFQSSAQNKMYESFKKDNELKAAFIKKDVSLFVKEPVLFMCDTIERTVDAKALNDLLKQYVPVPKKAEIRKASETNNGYVQTFGIYKNDDALIYVRFSISPHTGHIEEVMVESNN